MESIKFWENWEPGFQRAFKFFGVVVLTLSIALLIAAWRSPAPSISWQYLQEREVGEKLIHQFQTGPFALQVAADNIVLTEKLLGNEFTFQIWPVYVYLACTLLGLVILVTVLSTLSRFWFFLGSGFLIFLLTSLKLELLYVLGQENQYAALFLIVVIVGSGLMFQHYFQTASFLKRLITFAISIVGSFSLLIVLSEVPNPGYFLAVGFIPATVLACALLAIATAHEIIATIIYLITRGLKGSNGFTHFIVLSTIYIANLVASYLNDQNYLTWEYSLNPIILMMVSAILAVWGIRRQQEQMDGFIFYGPYGPVAILGMSIIAFSSSAFFYTTGNDAAITTIRNISLYAHIGFGSIFVLYVISNFGSLLKDNYPVSKVLYKPNSMPFFTFRLAGSIAVLGFVLYNFWQRPINDTKGARDAAIGDYYIVSDNIPMAEGYYKNSDYYAFHNHHANFVLGNIEEARGNTVKARQYYLNAAERRPTQQAYMNALHTLDQSPLKVYAYIDDIKSDFPKSGVANNALGLVYSKLNQIDSAIYYFNQAKQDDLTEATAEINLLATAIRQSLSLNVDSIYQSLDNKEPGPLANTFALANKEQVYLNHDVTLSQDTTLNLFTSTLLNNFLVNHADSLDTAFISQVEMLARRPSSSDYFETVITACAHAYYKNGQINRAFKLMQEATIYTSAQGRNNNTMALWSLDQMAPTEAAKYAEYAFSQGYPGSLLTHAIALTESGRIGEAIMAWDSVRKSSSLAASADAMVRVLAVQKNMISALSDMEKYAYCRYRLGYADSVQFNSILASITDTDWKARTIFDRSKKLFEWDELKAAINTYNLLNGIGIADKKLANNIQRLELQMAAAIGNVDIIKSKIKGIKWERHRMSEMIFYDALINLSESDTIKAKQNFNWLANHDYFFVDGVLAASQYVKRTSTDPLASYTILANALQANSKSARLLKAYIVEAGAMGFDQYATDAMETLRQVLPEPLFKRFTIILQ
jgi:hypothetical protein